MLRVRSERKRTSKEKSRLFTLENCETKSREEFHSSSAFLLSLLFSPRSIMPPRRGRAAAAALPAETHNNENEAAAAAPLASSKQATTTALNANAAVTFSTPKLTLRTFSRKKNAVEVSKRGYSLEQRTAIGSKRT